MTNNVGWLLLNSSTIKVRIQDWELSGSALNADDQHYASDTHFGFYMGEIRRSLKCMGVQFDTQADCESFLAAIKTYNASGAWVVEVQTTTAGGKFKFDGTNTSMKVLCMSFRGLRKVGREDDSHYEIRQLEFVQFATTT